jgi:hypothetical protein
MKVLAGLFFLALPSTSLAQNQAPLARAGVMTCRLETNVPPQVTNTASAAWRVVRAQFPDSPPGIEINPIRQTSNLPIFLVKDALEGSNICDPNPPGNGNGSIREFDSQTVVGICHAREGTVICSSEAIGFILKAENQSDVSPSLSYLFAHEFGHILLKHPGAFMEGVNVVRLSKVRDDNIAQLSASCERDPEQLKREKSADEFAFAALKTLFASSPFRGEKQQPETSVLKNAEVVFGIGKQISNWASQYYGASDINPFPKPKELCGIIARDRGVVVVPVYGGSHPLPFNRLASIVNFESDYLSSLRITQGRSLSGGDDAAVGRNRMLDNLLAEAFEAAADQFCMRVSAIENGSLDCSHLPPPSPEDDLLPMKATPNSQKTETPIPFVPKGPYREVASAASVFEFTLKSYNSAPTRDLSLEEAKRMVSVYTDFFNELDRYLRDNGGYWVYETHTPVETDFLNLANEYMSSIEAHGIVRVPVEFKQRAIPALILMQRWGSGEYVHVEPWTKSKHVVVILHSFPHLIGAIKGTQRVMTRPLSLDEIFDLTAARDGHPVQPAAFFRDLLQFLGSRLTAKFGHCCIFDKGGDGVDSFYILPSTTGEDNFDLPQTWKELVDSNASRSTSDTDLATSVAHVWIDKVTEEDPMSIFGDKAEVPILGDKAQGFDVKQYEAQHPTIKDIGVRELGQLNLSDTQITSIWLSFRSPAGKQYTAVHVFSHPTGPYVLLSSKDRDPADIKVVAARFADVYQGKADPNVTDRLHDISLVVAVPGGFSQRTIASVASLLASEGYADLTVTAVHYDAKQ